MKERQPPDSRSPFAICIMKDAAIQYFRNCSSTTAAGEPTLERIARGIKAPKPNHREKVLLARSFPKGSEEYTRIKTEELPVVIFGALTSGGVSADDIVCLRPWIYLDIDSIPDERYNAVRDAVLTALPSTLLLWRSVGGHGIGMLLHADVRSTANRDTLKQELCSMSFEGHTFDPKVFNPTRKNVLSFDPDIYVNWDAPSHPIPGSVALPCLSNTSINRKIIVKKKVIHNRSKATTSHTYTPPTKIRRIRWSDKDDHHITGEDYSTHQEGRSFHAQRYPYVREGGRTLAVLQLASGLLFLNPWMAKDPDQLIYHCLLFNDTRCVDHTGKSAPLPLVKVVSNVMQAIAHPVEPPSKRGFIFFDPKSKLSTNEKKRIALREGSKLRKHRTWKKILAQLEHGNTSIASIARAIGMNRSSLSKRYGMNIRSYLDTIAGTEARLPQAEATVLTAHLTNDHGQRMEGSEASTGQTPIPVEEVEKGQRSHEMDRTPCLLAACTSTIRAHASMP